MQSKINLMEALKILPNGEFIKICAVNILVWQCEGIQPFFLCAFKIRFVIIIAIILLEKMWHLISPTLFVRKTNIFWDSKYLLTWMYKHGCTCVNSWKLYFALKCFTFMGDLFQTSHRNLYRNQSTITHIIFSKIQRKQSPLYGPNSTWNPFFCGHLKTSVYLFNVSAQFPQIPSKPMQIQFPKNEYMTI